MRKSLLSPIGSSSAAPGLEWLDLEQVARVEVSSEAEGYPVEALEKWPAAWFEDMLPWQLEIIYEINRRFLSDVRRLLPGDEGHIQRLSLIEE